MHIAIIDVCSPDADFDQYGTSGEIIQRWLEPHIGREALTIVNGCLDALPPPTDYDGYVLSGSEKGVYDDAKWIEGLKTFLLAARARDVPLFGICFGHQIMAEAFGGRTQLADKGFVVGAREFTRGDTTFSAYVMHRDQVTSIPPDAIVSMTAGYCPIAALDYHFPARSVQFHPEYTHSFVAAAIKVFDGNLLSENEAIRSRVSLDKYPVKDALLAAEVAEFFRQHCR